MLINGGGEWLWWKYRVLVRGVAYSSAGCNGIHGWENVGLQLVGGVYSVRYRGYGWLSVGLRFAWWLMLSSASWKCARNSVRVGGYGLMLMGWGGWLVADEEESWIEWKIWSVSSTSKRLCIWWQWASKSLNKEVEGQLSNVLVIVIMIVDRLINWHSNRETGPPFFQPLRCWKVNEQP